VIKEILFLPRTPLPPGQSVDSELIDVSGAQHLTVNVALERIFQNVECRIHFGMEGAAFFTLKTETFSRPELLTLVPVHGPVLQVTLRNNGPDPAGIFAGWVYGVREAS
jgi:hypothetical protein